MNLQGILKKYCAKAFNAQVWGRTYNLWIGKLMLYHCTTYSDDNNAEKYKVVEKMALRHFPHLYT
jgi:hypothetical protein